MSEAKPTRAVRPLRRKSGEQAISPFPLLFLDCDGVLNTHDPHENGYCGLHVDKVLRLNRIVELTGAEVVLSSAWRYMVLGKDITLKGFTYLLLTYGLAQWVRIVGHTASDEEIPERGEQIAHYLRAAGNPRYVILDDGGQTPPIKGAKVTMTQSLACQHGARWVQIDGRVGLTEEDAQRAIKLLQRDVDGREA